MTAEAVARPGSASLGNYTDFPSATPHRLPFSALCWRARSYGRRLLGEAGMTRSRVSWCGTRLSYRMRCVPVIRRPDRATARLGNLCVCGQTLVCPVCAPRVSMVRAAEIGAGWQRWHDIGGLAHMLTFTSPHKAGSPLLDEVDFWREAWSEMMDGSRSANQLRKQRVGYQNALEMTFGRNGWHVHRHLLMYHRGGLDLAAHQRRWMDCLGARYSIDAEKHAFDAIAVDAKQIAVYNSKVGAEMASSLTKDGRTPLRMLVDAAAAEEPAPQWIEAVKVVGARKLSIVRWSPGLRDILGVGAEKSDEEIAKEEATRTDEYLGALSWAQWRRVRDRGLEWQLVNEAQHGQEALDLWLTANGIGMLFWDEEAYEEFLTSKEDETETVTINPIQ